MSQETSFLSDQGWLLSGGSIVFSIPLLFGNNDGNHHGIGVHSVLSCIAGNCIGMNFRNAAISTNRISPDQRHFTRLTFFLHVCYSPSSSALRISRIGENLCSGDNYSCITMYSKSHFAWTNLIKTYSFGGIHGG